jgi:hypothetical protein
MAGKRVTDSGWSLQRTVSVKMTPGGVFVAGLLSGLAGTLLAEGLGLWLLSYLR